MDLLSKSDPQLVVYEQDNRTRGWKQLWKSEMIE